MHQFVSAIKRFAARLTRRKSRTSLKTAMKSADDTIHRRFRAIRRISIADILKLESLLRLRLFNDNQIIIIKKSMLSHKASLGIYLTLAQRCMFSLLLSMGIASAFPPAPYYTLYGVVRDQVGQTVTEIGRAHV
jgi:hypothetical protein